MFRRVWFWRFMLGELRASVGGETDALAPIPGPPPQIRDLMARG